jgi:Tol biopolymer transport system component
LLAFIPKDLSSDCVPLDRAGSSDAPALVCSGDGLEVLYEKFATRDAMNALFQANVSVRGATGGECAVDDVALTPYTIDGQPAGRMLCYRQSSRAGSTFEPSESAVRSHIEWTDERTLIYAHAVRDDPGDLSLFDWWLTSSGPVIPGEGGAPAAKDPPATLAPSLPEGSYLLSLTRQDTVRSGLNSISGIKGVSTGSAGWEGTWALSVEAGSYELAHQGAYVEDGTYVLQKPNVVVFTPATGDCSTVSPVPTAYHWSAQGTELSWDVEKIRGCAGPQPLTKLGWSRAPRGQIAYQALGGDLYLADAAGLNQVQITHANFDARLFNVEPVWSPDGSRLAYAGLGEDISGVFQTGSYHLFAINPDGTDPAQLTEGVGNQFDPAWSPDGTKIAFHSDDVTKGYNFAPSELDIVNADGSGHTTLIARSGFIGRPAWSPDGTKIALVIDTSIYVVDADGSNLTRLYAYAFGAQGGVDAPVWTPDGKRIVFWSSGRQIGSGTLLSMRPDGSDVRDLFASLPSPVKFLVPDWTPDGRWIVVSDAWYTGQSDTRDHPIYLISGDGTQVFTIVDNGLEPKWRPGTT